VVLVASLSFLAAACGSKKGGVNATNVPDMTEKSITGAAGSKTTTSSRANEANAAVSIVLTVENISFSDDGIQGRLVASVKGKSKRATFACMAPCPAGTSVDPGSGVFRVPFSGPGDPSPFVIFEATAESTRSTAFFHTMPHSQVGVDSAATPGSAAGASTDAGSNIPLCGANLSIQCKATTEFPAVDAAALIPANIRFGVTLGGQVGLYPSLLAPLSNATTTLDLTAFDSSVSAGSYEFFDSTGLRYTGNVVDLGLLTPETSTQALTATSGFIRSFSVAGDPNLSAGNIRNGVSLFGVTGNVVAKPSDCSLDGATNCVATGTFPAAKVADVAATDLRLGKSLGGINGLLAPCAQSGDTACVTSPSVLAVTVDDITNTLLACGETFLGITNTCPAAPWLYHSSLAASANTYRETVGSTDYELGVKVRFKRAGSITKVRIYIASLEQGTHIARVWSEAGALLASATFPAVTESDSWMEVTLSSPLAVEAGDVVVVSSNFNEYFSAVDVDWSALSAASLNVEAVDSDALPLEAPIRAGVWAANPGDFPTEVNPGPVWHYLVDFAFTPENP
jgi:hypothetical protein